MASTLVATTRPKTIQKASTQNRPSHHPLLGTPPVFALSLSRLCLALRADSQAFRASLSWVAWSKELFTITAVTWIHATAPIRVRPRSRAPKGGADQVLGRGSLTRSLSGATSVPPRRDPRPGPNPGGVWDLKSVAEGPGKGCFQRLGRPKQVVGIGYRGLAASVRGAFLARARALAGVVASWPLQDFHAIVREPLKTISSLHELELESIDCLSIIVLRTSSLVRSCLFGVTAGCFSHLQPIPVPHSIYSNIFKPKLSQTLHGTGVCLH